MNYTIMREYFLKVEEDSTVKHTRFNYNCNLLSLSYAVGTTNTPRVVTNNCNLSVDGWVNILAVMHSVSQVRVEGNED